MLGAGLIDGDLLTGLLVRTFAYTVEAYAVDHYAAARPNSGSVAFAGGGSGPTRAVSQALLLTLARDPSEAVRVSHDRPRMIPGGLTRVALRTLDGALVVVAFKGYVEDTVARRLADLIANALWRERYRVRRRPVPARAFDPSNIDGLGTPLPSYASIGRLINRAR
jgi:hypothetical protein